MNDEEVESRIGAIWELVRRYNGRSLWTPYRNHIDDVDI